MKTSTVCVKETSVLSSTPALQPEQETRAQKTEMRRKLFLNGHSVCIWVVRIVSSLNFS